MGGTQSSSAGSPDLAEEARAKEAEIREQILAQGLTPTSVGQYVPTHALAPLHACSSPSMLLASRLEASGTPHSFLVATMAAFSVPRPDACKHPTSEAASCSGQVPGPRRYRHRRRDERDRIRGRTSDVGTKGRGSVPRAAAGRLV